MSKHRVLLTSVLSPMGPRYGDAYSVRSDVFHPYTGFQGVFGLSSIERHYALDYIAANLDAPATVLQYPTERDLVRELRAHAYTHVGITFNAPLFHRLEPMARLIRRHAPDATIVIGGYGTVIPEELLAPHCDVYCHGEGVRFMRELLGEPKREPPYDHPLLLNTVRALGIPTSRVGPVFAGLGCPFGCDFCQTSHYYGRKQIPLLPTGQDLFRVVQAYQQLEPDADIKMYDEDFLLDRKRALEFRDEVQAHDAHVGMFVLTSVNSLSRYTMQELVEIGVNIVFVGFEGLEASYSKLRGRPVKELFADLKRHGILIVGSMILGLEYHTPEIIRGEFEALLDLGVTFPQFIIYCPGIGTPLGDRVEREQRWRFSSRRRTWHDSDGFTCVFDHPTMAPEELEAMQRWCYEQEFQRLGPSVFRAAEAWLAGWEQLRYRADGASRRRAADLEKRLNLTGSLITLGRLLAPNPQVRQQVEALREDLRRVTSPGQRAANRLLGLAALPAAAVTAARRRLDLVHPRVQRNPWGGPDHPPVVRFDRGR